MAITPLDILQKQFGPARRGGYDADEVQRFLDEVRESLEGSLRDNLRLREELLRRDQEIAELRAESGEVREALVMARRLVIEMESNARREADLLVGEARLEAERILSTAHEEQRSLQESIVRLKSLRLNHISQVRVLLVATERMLEDLDGPE